jgi:uncharacterized protein (DUF433 family)
VVFASNPVDELVASMDPDPVVGQIDGNRRQLKPQENAPMPQLTRITRDARVMGGKPCIRGMRVTVGTVVGLVAAGRTNEEILREYPYLEAADIAEALSYAAWRAEEVEVPLGQQ